MRNKNTRDSPDLTFKEVQFAVRGRYRFNTETKTYDVAYKPYRDYWIIYLLTTSERIFAL